MRVIKIFSISVFVVTSLIFLLYLFAFLQLNILAVMLSNDLKSIGILKDKGKIVASLEDNNMVPKIVFTEPDYIVFSLAKVMSGQDNFYGKYVLGVIPQSFILHEDKIDEGMLLMDNTLFIMDINASDLQAISPVVGHLFVKEYFPERKIKFYPKTAVMSKDEYLEYREKSLEKRLESLDLETEKVVDGINKILGDIEKASSMIGQNQRIINEAQAVRNTKSKNNAVRKKMDKEIAQGKKNISDWNNILQGNRTKLARYQSYKTLLEKQKDIMHSKQQNISNELGVFEPTDTIKVLFGYCPKREWVPVRHAQGLSFDRRPGLRQGMTNGGDCENKEILIGYLDTMVHEYLHYASFISKEKKFSNAFFDEGLTEYFARKVLGKSLGESTVLGYPVQVEIISEIGKKVPDGELQNIYFSKDQKKLEEILDKTYGKDFYKNNEILFQTLQYTSDQDQMLKIANEIMEKIGSAKLKEKDLVSGF